MSVVRATHKKSLAFTIAFAMLVALAIPFAGLALASHSGNNSHDLQVIQETDENSTGQTHTLTAYVPGCFASTGAPTDTCNVDFEVESGPAIFVQKSEVNLNQSVDDGDTELTPDMSCTVDENRADDPATGGDESTEEVCSVQFTSGTQGVNVIRAWVDEGGNATADADQTEGRNAGASDCVTPNPGNVPGGIPNDPAVCSDPGTPGDDPEVDDTDVVSKSWIGPTPAVILDCDDASGQSSNDSNVSDADVNPPGQAEVYTCRAWNTTTQANASGVNIDAEAAAQGGGPNGANDPDNRGWNPVDAANTTADFDNACVTGPDGTCTFSFTPSENETGGADLCFWIDTDNDNQFAPGGSAADGAECDNEAFNQGEDGNSNRGDDSTDVVRKTWGAAGPATLDAEPENDANQTGTVGTQHTVTVTLQDSFGNPSANTPVDFVILAGSRNDLSGADRVICDNKLTNASGQVDCTYTDEGTTTDPIPFGSFETDLIRACVDATSTAGAAACSATTEPSNEAESNDTADQVEKYWFLTIPTAGSLDFDVNASFGQYTGGTCSGPYDISDDVEVNGVNVICALVEDANGNPIAGKGVTFTINGTGVFFDDRDQDAVKDANEPELGKTVTVGADASGDAFATIWSNTTGTSTVTATSDSQTRSATKTWIPGEPRRVECPEGATNAPGTTHIVRCDVTDRNGNPVGGVLFQAVENGPGSFEDCPDLFTDDHYSNSSNVLVCENTSDSSGQVEFQITSGTEGTQTVEVAVEDDAEGGPEDRGNAGTPSPNQDDDDACDARADEGYDGNNTEGLNSDPGAPAGQCFDSFVKTWGDDDPDLAECEDGIDNDNDGFIDFPDDPECASANDDDEDDDDEPVAPRACRNPEGNPNVIVGTPGNDVLRGTNGRDIICGAGGDDVISARGGADLVVGNRGDDVIGGGGGRDNLAGNGGNDTIAGGSKSDAIKGNAGNDTLKGQKGVDSLLGGGGNDSLQGAGAGDIVKGGQGNDTLRGGKGPDLLDGGKGTDQCFGGPGRDRLRRCE